MIEGDKGLQVGLMMMMSLFVAVGERKRGRELEVGGIGLWGGD